MSATSTVRRGAPPKGVRFLEHTADTAVEVRASSLEECFARAAAGMFAVFVGPAGRGAEMESIAVDVTAPNPAELLVSWLEELLYLSEVRGLALQAFTVSRLGPDRVVGCAQGARFGPDAAAAGPVVKGVSRHDLQLRRSGGRWLARVIFDV